MTPIQRRKHAASAPSSAVPAPLPLAAALMTGLALSAPFAASAQDAGQAATGGPSADDQVRTLGKVQVVGEAGQPQLASPKFTQSLQDTPQTIQVIGSDLFNQQGATSLAEALRNSPGVGTFYAGENGNSSTGDTVYMRGFDTSSSIYVDGVRDLGSVSRDVFNTEQIEVTKGPAGTDNGRSAPTGAINMVSKHARLEDAVSATASYGTEGRKRATADWNVVLGDSAALRLNAMWQDSDVAGRDHVNDSRRGLAASLGFGLGTATRYGLDLLSVEQDNVPDGFVPTIGLPGWSPQEGLEHLAGHPVDPSNFYGTRDDHDDVEARMATFRFEHDVSDAVRITNTARWGRTRQDYLLTSFMGTGTFEDDDGIVHYDADGNPIPQGNIRWTDADDLSTYTLARSSNTFKDQDNTILTDQLNLRAEFATGAVHHSLSTGLELTREEQETRNVTATGSRPDANLYAPDWNDAGTLAWARNGTGSHGRTDTASIYAFDTLAFTDALLVTAGVRADRYTTKFDSTSPCNTPGTSGASGRRIVYCGSDPIGTIVSNGAFEASDTLLNWKLGAVYKLGAGANLYANYALSQQPPGGANFQLSAGSGSANGVNADPQKAKTFEVGGKWSLLDGALALNAALYRTDVSNEINSQVLDDAGNPTQTGRKQVKGFELSAVGAITPNWSVSAGYTHQDATVDEGAPVAVDGTYNLTYTPGDAFTGWTTYRFPSGLTVGGGVRHTGGLHRGTDGAVGTPAYTKSWTVYDAVASFEVNDSLTLRLNAYNLFDKRYVASINKSGYRYLPGAPRTVLLSADFRF